MNKKKLVKVYVLIPDKASGDLFAKVLGKKGITTEYTYRRICPRVIENKITTSKCIVEDMNKIFETFTDETRSVVIACNTLQLWLDDIDEKHKRNVKVYTTFEACEWKFEKNKNKPVWLGTTPLVRRTTKFPTLLSLGDEDTQELVQELIWRIKLRAGDDTKTAPKRVKKDNGKSWIFQTRKIIGLKKQIIGVLKDKGTRNVILGCTELPMVFKKRESGINFVDPAEILAGYVKYQSTSIIFAGGTISSLANEKGIRSGGKVFDLLERLNGVYPGSYKKLNITKYGVVFSGLSENMTEKNHKDLLLATREIIRSGIKEILITHGTDNMEQTARYLDKNLKRLIRKTKSIINITGADFDISHPKTDVWENLHTSFNRKDKQKPGVYIAFHKRLVPAKLVVKEYFFDKPMSYISKNDPEYKEQTRRYQEENKKLILKLKNKLGVNSSNRILKYDVNVIRKNHKKFLKEVKNTKPKAVLFKLYHSGTANTSSPHSSVSELVNILSRKGVYCFGATENGEPTDLHLYETSKRLLESGMIPLYNMRFPVAYKKLKMLAKRDNTDLLQKMLKSYVGEIDEKQIVKKDIDKLIKLYSWANI